MEQKEMLVSILVRTCGRPEVLKECLQSIRNQTYKNIQVCIAEDGENISEAYIKQNFSDLNIKYCATGEKKGRSHVGNLALSMAKGQYFNFLDDDDILYAEHIETMVQAVLQFRNAKMFYAKAYEAIIEIESENPYTYTVKDRILPNRSSYTKNTLLVNNIFPIQTVFFSRHMYDEYGGFCEEYEYLEDWDLWLRFALYADYIEINQITSEYRVPAETEKAMERQELLRENESKIRKQYIRAQKITDADISLHHTYALRYRIENVRMLSEDVLYVSGWAVYKKKNYDDVCLLITDREKKQHIYKVQHHTRKDVVQTYPEAAGTDVGISAVVVFKDKDIEKIELICRTGQNYYKNKWYAYSMKKHKKQ